MCASAASRRIFVHQARSRRLAADWTGLLTRPIYLVVNALPILAFIGLVVMRKRRESLAMNVGYARSRAASRRPQATGSSEGVGDGQKVRGISRRSESSRHAIHRRQGEYLTPRSDD